MNAPFLSGVLAASAAAQVALGAFFALAYVLGRREREYLLFSMLCFALAIISAGISWGYGVTSPKDWLVSSRLIHVGAPFAMVLNLHFVASYSGVRVGRTVAILAYALAALYVALNLAGAWYEPGTLRIQQTDLFGARIEHVAIELSLAAQSFYLLAVGSIALTLVLLYYAVRSGKREALTSVIGVGVLGLAIVNDVLLLMGVVTHTVFLHPHGFLVYAFGVGITLLVRYRLTAGQLEQTASSLRERTEELRHSHAELRLVQDELLTKQQLAAVGELAAAIAHEVRNPLAVIVNAVAGLRRAGLGEADRTMLLDIVEEEAARLNHLVTDLLRFARPVNVQRSSTSLAELARRSDALKRQPAVELVVDEAPDAHAVSVDPALFRLVFDNLIDNACQAMASSGTIEVVVRRDHLDGESAVRIELKDSGHGMDTVVLNRARKPFFTTRPSGTGLGLPIVQRIVEGHGGRLSLDSQPGKGTIVTLLVPEVGPNDLTPSGVERIAEAERHRFARRGASV